MKMENEEEKEKEGREGGEVKGWRQVKEEGGNR